MQRRARSARRPSYPRHRPGRRTTRRPFRSSDAVDGRQRATVHAAPAPSTRRAGGDDAIIAHYGGATRQPLVARPPAASAAATPATAHAAADARGVGRRPRVRSFHRAPTPTATPARPTIFPPRPAAPTPRASARRRRLRRLLGPSDAPRRGHADDCRPPGSSDHAANDASDGATGGAERPNRCAATAPRWPSPPAAPRVVGAAPAAPTPTRAPINPFLANDPNAKARAARARARLRIVDVLSAATRRRAARRNAEASCSARRSRRATRNTSSRWARSSPRRRRTFRMR